jgi:hypothetical protein
MGEGGVVQDGLRFVLVVPRLRNELFDMGGIVRAQGMLTHQGQPAMQRGANVNQEIQKFYQIQLIVSPYLRIQCAVNRR